MSNKILVFKHMPSQNPGVFRSFAQQQNVEFTEIDLHAGDAIPNLREFDGLWVMGGSMNVWDEQLYPWLVEEKRAIRFAVDVLKMPFLGICLGHQLLAQAMGGTVEATQQHEVGLFEIKPTEDGVGHPLLANLPQPSVWVNVHMAEVTQKPEHAIILAKSEACHNQIMQVGLNAYSCQFHPEVCSHTVSGWMQILGIPEALEKLLGMDGLAHFKASVADSLGQHNVAALQLFENWNRLVFDTGPERATVMS
jgi:GMP synthase-like glutamine amidotransferase